MGRLRGGLQAGYQKMLVVNEDVKPSERFVVCRVLISP